MSRPVRELLSVRAAIRDVHWLQESLQTALAVELATIPPYLTAYWSIDPTQDPDGIADILGSIVVEEMLHVGLLCNMLAAIGGSPIFTDPEMLPSYPGPMPGGVHPGLIVGLRRLTLGTIDVFMGIENTQYWPVAREIFRPDTRNSISEFYDTINAAFIVLDPPLSGVHQLEGVAIGLRKLHSMFDVTKAIRTIKDQGEGILQAPDEEPGLTVLGHYYRLAEVFHGRRLRKDPESRNWSFTGEELRFPKVLPMADIPSGGYRPSNVPTGDWPLVRPQLVQFDSAYSLLLKCLQSAWELGSQAQLSAAVSNFHNLASCALALMNTPIDGSQGHYGPCFRFVHS